MEMHGIKFDNRTKTCGADAEDPAQMDAKFVAFSALCASLGFAAYVRGVEYNGNWCGYSIDVDRWHEYTPVGAGIEWAAEQSLPQFEIFGCVGHKGGTDDDA